MLISRRMFSTMRETQKNLRIKWDSESYMKTPVFETGMIVQIWKFEVFFGGAGEDRGEGWGKSRVERWLRRNGGNGCQDEGERH